MENTHILNGDRLAEPIEVTYKDGVLSEIRFPTKYPLTLVQHTAFFKHIPYSEEVLEFNMGLIKLRVEKATPTHKKIALFCTMYSRYKGGLKYNMLPADKGRIKLIKIDEEILTFYFSKSTAFEIVGKDGKGKHSVNNLVTYYNLLLQEIASAGKSKFPDHWTEAYENGLKTHQERNDYWAHLRSIGLVPKKDRVGKTIDWEKASTETSNYSHRD